MFLTFARCPKRSRSALPPRYARHRCAVILALVGVAGAFATNGIEPIDTSLQARLRGGADIAVGDSPLSQVHNPATLALHHRPAFDFSGQLAFPIVHWETPVDSSNSEVRAVPLANVGLSLPINERTTFGLALHSKAGLASQYHMRHLLIPFMDRLTGADSKCVGLHANIGYKLTDKLSIGAGVRGEVSTAEFSMVLGPADTSFGRGYAFGGGFQLGLHYQARPDLAFALSYRSTSWFGDLGGGRGKASLFGLIPVGLGDIQIENLRLPRRITAGVAWDATDWFKLVGEVRWINYRNSSYHRLDISTGDPFNLRLPLPLGFRDQWVFAVGGEFKLDDHWTLGMGYNFGTDPIDRWSLCPVSSILAQHHITVGLRYERDNWWVGAGYVLALHQRLRGDGFSRIPLGFDYAYSTVDQTQHSLIFGFGFRW